MKVTITVPVLELGVDWEDVEEAAGEAGRESMRVKGGGRGDNLAGLNDAAAEGAQEELVDQEDQLIVQVGSRTFKTR